MSKTVNQILFNSKTPQHKYLSNMHVGPVPLNTGKSEVVFPSAEAAYQGGKLYLITGDYSWIEKLANTPNPFEAKKLGKDYSPKDRNVLISLMERIVRSKFNQDEDLKQKLISTVGYELIHYCPWGDTYWGVDSSMNGSNHLGKLLMKVRSDLRYTERTATSNG
jgi:ribA/ribD-fused uncharacterized protein